MGEERKWFLRRWIDKWISDFKTDIIDEIKKDRLAKKRIRCKHPFDQTHLCGIFNEIEADSSPGYIYRVNVRRCDFCEKHYIDEGLESTQRKT
jgi:hypothetical protein